MHESGKMMGIRKIEIQGCFKDGPFYVLSYEAWSKE